MTRDSAPRDHGDPGDAPSVPPPLEIPSPMPFARRLRRRPARSRRRPTSATLAFADGRRQPVGVFRDVRGARRRCAGAVCFQPRRTRPQPGRRPAGQPLDRRAGNGGGRIRSPTDADHAGGRHGEAVGGDEHAAARQAHLERRAQRPSTTSTTATSPCGVLRVQRVRWVGGYGRMDSATAEELRGGHARPDHARPQRTPSTTSTPTTRPHWPPWRARSAATRHARGHLHRRRPVRTGPARRHPARAGRDPRRISAAARRNRRTQRSSATVELTRRARSA